MRINSQTSTKSPEQEKRKTTVQYYLDEIPRWKDGSKTQYVPMTSTQWYIWIVSVFGKLFEGMLIFIMGITIPIIAYAFKLSLIETSCLSGSIIFGVMLGASALAGFADKYGRKKIFILEMIILSVCLIFMSISTNYWCILFFNFAMGIPLGSDYPIANIITSEAVPTRNRGKLVLGIFSFQAVGAFLGILLGVGVLTFYPHVYAWRIMYIAIIIPSVVITVMRFFVPESPHWLVLKKRKLEAEHSLKKILKRKLSYPLSTTLEEQITTTPAKYRELFNKKHISRVILTGGTWFLQDMSTYGLGIFTPVVIATIIGKYNAFHGTHAYNIQYIIDKILYSAKGVVFLDLFLILGMVASILYSDKIGRMRLQIIGFIGCAVGLAIAAISTYFAGQLQIILIFAGFLIFNFMDNLGPNSQTYIIAGEVFPTKLRARGAGLAATIGKIGALISTFLFPILIVKLGITALLFLLVGASILGAILTYCFKFETANKNLENVD